MKRVGELYEVVVFTASVSKVSPEFNNEASVRLWSLTTPAVWRSVT
jgi:hypothetical protein